MKDPRVTEELAQVAVSLGLRVRPLKTGTRYQMEFGGGEVDKDANVIFRVQRVRPATREEWMLYDRIVRMHGLGGGGGGAA